MVCNLLCVQAIRNNIDKFVIELFLDTRAYTQIFTYKSERKFYRDFSRLRSYKLKAKDTRTAITIMQK